VTVPAYELGINTCFAVKRWPEPDRWAEIVRDRLGLELVQHCLDLVALDAPARVRERQASEIRSACDRFGLTLHSTFTGLAAYSANLLLDPDPALRRHAELWYRRAIDFTAMAGGRATGGHVGAYSVSDWTDAGRQAELEQDLRASLSRLSRRARRAGLEALYVENLASAREPSTMEGISRLLTSGDDSRVPIELCLDVGHMCVPGTMGADRDPYAWLERFGARAPVVQLQQSDAEGDHHWPFTKAANAMGRIEAGRVLEALDRSGAERVALILEIIPAFEAPDDRVVDELVESVEYWRSALEQDRPDDEPPRVGRSAGHTSCAG
jgi:D-erythrulose 1-phosphate 3-epimerase